MQTNIMELSTIILSQKIPQDSSCPGLLIVLMGKFFWIFRQKIWSLWAGSVIKPTQSTDLKRPWPMWSTVRQKDISTWASISEGRKWREPLRSGCIWDGCRWVLCFHWWKMEERVNTLLGYSITKLSTYIATSLFFITISNHFSSLLEPKPSSKKYQ